MTDYLLKHSWDQERRRLDLLEQVFDPGTEEHLGRIPLPAGGRRLERAIAACHEDGFCALDPTLVTVWGRRPLG